MRRGRKSEGEAAKDGGRETRSEELQTTSHNAPEATKNNRSACHNHHG